MRFKTTLLAAVLGFVFQPAFADPLPETINFRKNPAFLRIEASEAQLSQLKRLQNEKCPDKKAYDEATKQVQKLDDEERELKKKLKQPKPTFAPADDRLKEKMDKPTLARLEALKAEKESMRLESHKRWAQVLKCSQKLSHELAVVIPLFKDVGFTQPAGELRVMQAFEMDLPLAFRADPKADWQRFEGDFIPAGEDGYAYQTVLEKRGDKILLPKRPFATPVWFDFKKAFGRALAADTERLPLEFLFGKKRVPDAYGFSAEVPLAAKSVSGDFYPLRIENETAVLRLNSGKFEGDDEIWSVDEVQRLSREGRVIRVPLKSFFDRDGHLIVLSAAGC